MDCENQRQINTTLPPISFPFPRVEVTLSPCSEQCGEDDGGMQSDHNSSFSLLYSPAPPWATVYSVNIPLLWCGVLHRLQCGYLLHKSCRRISALVLGPLPPPLSLTLISAEVSDMFSFLISPSHSSVVVLSFLNQIFLEELPA